MNRLFLIIVATFVWLVATPETKADEHDAPYGYRCVKDSRGIPNFFCNKDLGYGLNINPTGKKRRFDNFGFGMNWGGSTYKPGRRPTPQWAPIPDPPSWPNPSYEYKRWN